MRMLREPRWKFKVCMNEVQEWIHYINVLAVNNHSRCVNITLLLFVLGIPFIWLYKGGAKSQNSLETGADEYALKKEGK
jgi:hypothetical protein